MTGDGERGDDDRSTAGRLRRRWVTISRPDAYVHLFVGQRGTVMKGPRPVLGTYVHHLARHVGDGRLVVHSTGPPFGYNAHPSYHELRAAEAPQRTEGDAERGLAAALADAPIAPWVRVERQRLITAAQVAMRRGDVSLLLQTTGVVPAERLAAIRAQIAGLPLLYCALWQAAGFPITVVGPRHEALPDLIERERKAGVPGVFEPRLEHVYLLPGALSRSDAYAAATALEEIGHGLDVILGRLLGLAGQSDLALPSAATYRSAQADVAALYTRYAGRAALPRYYRSNPRELFAFGLFSYYRNDATLKRSAPALYRFIGALEQEVATYVAFDPLATHPDSD